MSETNSKKFKRGTVVSILNGAIMGIVQNETESGTHIRITTDPEDPSQLYATSGDRLWLIIPKSWAKAVER